MEFSKEFIKIKNDIEEYRIKTGLYPRKIYMTEQFYKTLCSQADEIVLTNKPNKPNKPYETIFGIKIEVVYNYKLRE